MKNRTPLKPNTELFFTNHAGGWMHYVVGELIGQGGSCLVYDGFYVNNAGLKNTVRIKECYPHKLNLDRNEDGSLHVLERDAQMFQAYKERLRTSFVVLNELHQTSGLTNLTSNVFDLYEANQTIYIVSSYTEANTLEKTQIPDIMTAIQIVISIAKSIEKIHECGFLYLDLKPENVLIYQETPDFVQLFDFDSVIPMEPEEGTAEYKISYSAGFSPMEQKLGNLSKLGRSSDVYSLGAVFFYLLFGRTPRAMDCGYEATYDYEQLQWKQPLRQKVYKQLTEFFHHTLQSFYMDRYQTIAEVLKQLELIAKYAALPVPWINTNFVSNDEIVIGREQELQAIEAWWKDEQTLLFVTGMGGIGKSTLVRKFATEHRNQYDTILYLKYHNNITETITDDVSFCIHGYEQKSEESLNDYYMRKLKVAKELTKDAKVLLIIDNFSGLLEEYFTTLLSTNWKIIVITRQNMSDYAYACIHVTALPHKNEQYHLFEHHLGRTISEHERKKVDTLIRFVAGHTLALVLIAKQMKKSYLSMEEAVTLAKNNGFTEIAPEKVNYMQDDRTYYEKISTIVKAIFDVSVLSEIKISCLKLLSLFDTKGVGVHEAKSLLHLESLDEINELVEQGFLEVTQNRISMHPLIQEMLHQVPWTSEQRILAVAKLEELYQTIQKEIPFKNTYATNKDHSRNQRCFRAELEIARTILFHAGRDALLREHKAYSALLHVTLMNTPKDQEDYVLSNCDKILHNPKFEDPCAKMELFDYVVTLKCQTNDYDGAIAYLKKAYELVKRENDHFIIGLYYEMLIDFYEEFLDGAYGSKEKEAIALIRKMLHANDRAIHHMKRSKHTNAQSLTAKYILSKASIMIRSMPEKKRTIKKLINRANKAIEKNVLELLEVIVTYSLVQAWYYTLCEPDMELVVRYLNDVYRKFQFQYVSDLELIDHYYIPAANMMWEFMEQEETLALLEEAICICEEHEEEIPYERKKQDLLKYHLEVCEES